MPIYTLDSAVPSADGTQIQVTVTATADDGRTLTGGGTCGAGSDLAQVATGIAAGLAAQLAAPPPEPPAPPAPLDVAHIVIDPAAVQAALADAS